jgi:GxxExxY protein
MLDEDTSPLTHAVIGAAMEVHAQLGPGFLERAYQEALGLELRDQGIAHAVEVAIPIHYKGRALTTVYRADLIVENVLVELKAQASMGRVEEAQLLHYLRATRLETGLLLNFGSMSLGVRRMTNRRLPGIPEIPVSAVGEAEATKP